jgi:MFS family permease
MLAIMTWTPVHMQHGSVGLAAIGAVLSGHFVGMFAFAPVFGWAADRLGRARTATFSAVLMLSALATLGLASPDATTQLGVGLFLLGLAWCGMFVVGSGLLTESIDPAARPAAQGLTDTAMWIFSAVAVGAAGWIIQVGGFGWLAGVCAVLVVPVLVLGGMLSATGEAKAADAS